MCCRTISRPVYLEIVKSKAAIAVDENLKSSLPGHVYGIPAVTDLPKLLFCRNQAEMMTALIVDTKCMSKNSVS